jgi:hypothetical protein
MRMQTEFVWFRRDIKSRRLGTRWQIYVLHKRYIISWPAELLSAPQGLCSMELSSSFSVRVSEIKTDKTVTLCMWILQFLGRTQENKRLWTECHFNGTGISWLSSWVRCGREQAANNTERIVISWLPHSKPTQPLPSATPSKHVAR